MDLILNDNVFEKQKVILEITCKKCNISLIKIEIVGEIRFKSWNRDIYCENCFITK